MNSPMQTSPNHWRRSAGRCNERNRSSIMTGSSICGNVRTLAIGLNSDICSAKLTPCSAAATAAEDSGASHWSMFNNRGWARVCVAFAGLRELVKGMLNSRSARPPHAMVAQPSV